jgi:hypothetical protein
VSISDWIREIVVPRISVDFVSKEAILLPDIDPWASEPYPIILINPPDKHIGVDSHIAVLVTIRHSLKII